MATSSGISALRLALYGLEIGAGDSVALPAYSCVALANAILACGAIPLPLEVEPGTWNLSPLALVAAKAASPNLRAAMVVHTFGYPADYTRLRSVGIPLIEDCSHGFGRGPMGTIGDVTILSLYATKLLGAGQGGLVLTSNARIEARVRDASDYVDKPMSPYRQRETMSAPEAALALCQLDRLDELLQRRDELADSYHEAFTDLERPARIGGRVWYRYTLTVPDSAAFVMELASHDIQAAVPIDNWLAPEHRAWCPVAARAHQQLVSLPLFPTLTREEQSRVIAAVRDVASRLAAHRESIR